MRNLPRGLLEVASKYDAFVFDQWGVMHDGHTALYDAPQILQELASLGKKLVILSNSSKLAQDPAIVPSVAHCIDLSPIYGLL